MAFHPSPEGVSGRTIQRYSHPDYMYIRRSTALTISRSDEKFLAHCRIAENLRKVFINQQGICRIQLILPITAPPLIEFAASIVEFPTNQTGSSIGAAAIMESIEIELLQER